jgi:hypothetical protein
VLISVSKEFPVVTAPSFPRLALSDRKKLTGAHVAAMNVKCTKHSVCIFMEQHALHRRLALAALLFLRQRGYIHR